MSRSQTVLRKRMPFFRCEACSRLERSDPDPDPGIGSTYSEATNVVWSQGKNRFSAPFSGSRQAASFPNQR